MKPSSRPLSLRDLRPDLLHAPPRRLSWWRRVDWLLIGIVAFLLFTCGWVMRHA